MQDINHQLIEMRSREMLHKAQQERQAQAFIQKQQQNDKHNKISLPQRLLQIFLLATQA